MANPSRPRRTQEERRATAEEALLRAAAELIAERGIDRTSLRGISERAGISRTMPAYHFGSKDVMIARIADRGHILTLAATAAELAYGEQHLGALPTLDALKIVIDTFLRTVISASPEERAVVVMWGATFPSESSYPAMLESDRETLRYLADFIAEGQHSGSIRKDVDPATAATVVVGMARGVAAMALTHPDTDVDAARELCGRSLDALLRA
jgi:AcrR family transcriptional regulator